MKIIKHGIAYKLRKVELDFKCPRCSCEFQATIKECERVRCERVFSLSDDTIYEGYQDKLVYSCRCPECDVLVEQEKR